MGNLRDEDGVGCGFRGGNEVGRAPDGLERVGPDDELAPSIAPFLDHRAHPLARLNLDLGRNRILQIENERVGRQRLCLLEGAVIGSRHVEDAAARTNIRLHGDPVPDVIVQRKILEHGRVHKPPIAT